MLGVFSAPAAILVQLKTSFGILLVLVARVILSFALGTGQDNYFSHKIKLPRARISPVPILKWANEQTVILQ